MEESNALKESHTDALPVHSATLYWDPSNNEELDPLTDPPTVPFASENTMSEATSLNILCEDTHLYAQLVRKLAEAEDQELMQKIALVTLFDELSNKCWQRSAPELQHDPYSFGRRVEYLLQTAEKQRRSHIERLLKRKDPRAREQALTFTDDDIQEIINEW